jgi:hypothetical protein
MKPWGNHSSDGDLIRIGRIDFGSEKAPGTSAWDHSVQSWEFFAFCGVATGENSELSAIFRAHSMLQISEAVPLHRRQMKWRGGEMDARIPKTWLF